MGTLTNLSLFSGVGGLDIAAKRTGKIRTGCYVEWSPYSQATLMSRFRSGTLEEAPIWDDVTTFDGRPWRGRVDIVSGGFPCQDLSHAGRRRGILKGPKSSLWREFIRVAKEISPRFILIENVPGLLSKGFEVVLSDLAKSGYDGIWFCLSAGYVGAPFRGDRLWVIAVSQYSKTNRLRFDRAPFDQHGGGITGRVELWNEQIGISRSLVQAHIREGIEPKIFRVANGLEYRSHRLGCCGNGVVPEQSSPAWEEILRLDN